MNPPTQQMQCWHLLQTITEKVQVSTYILLSLVKQRLPNYQMSSTLHHHAAKHKTFYLNIVIPLP